MKSKDKSNKKGHENTIGKIIYGFLLFMPLLAIAVTCAYVIFNKNAYQSYYGETINEYYYESFNDVETGEEYKFNSEPNTIYYTPRLDFYISNLDNIYVDNTTINNQIIAEKNNITHIRMFNYNNSFTAMWFYYNTNNYYSVDLNVRTITFTYKLNSYEGNVNYFYSFNELKTYNNYSFLNNVFYYSIDEVEQSPLFSWSKNSLIYTGMNETCQALDISNTFIPMILSYWLIMSVIYFLYDIILIILHVFHRKIHQLEESI